MLTTALGAKPYCALKLLEMTRNSWVASALGKGAASRALVSMLETPSSRYQVLPCRWPPAEAPDSVGKELFPGKVEACDISSLVTPGTDPRDSTDRARSAADPSPPLRRRPGRFQMWSC